MSYHPAESAQFNIAKNRTRYFIEGDCIPGRIELDGHVLDVSKHYVSPESLPIPLLVDGDYQCNTGIVTKLIPSGSILKFEAEIFNADTRIWSMDPLSAIHFGDLNFCSVKATTRPGSFGFTIAAVNLHTDWVFRGAQVDKLWAREPVMKLRDPTFRMTHEMYVSDRVKEKRAKEKMDRALRQAHEQGRKAATTIRSRTGGAK